MIGYYPGLPYTIPYKMLIKPDKSYDEDTIKLLSKFSWYNDVIILLPDNVDNQSALELVDYLRSNKVRSPKITYIVYSQLISDRDELEGIVESM